MSVSVVLYGRDGCCLCEEARTLLLRLAGSHQFVLEERNIDEDDELQRAYLERIPVIKIDGREAFELEVDERQLEQALADADRA
ncbi:MAG: glutaredoxin family protein [Solirubrobacterales bacterium]|nr:glutaredoxin family protein [Solirubrobacterales bacterium]